MPSIDFQAPNTMRTFTFGDITSSDYFLTRSISRSLLPPVDVETQEIPGRAGAHAVRSKLGIREFSIDVTLLEDSYEAMRADIRDIASWLYQDQDISLSFSDEPNVYYLARFVGGSELNELREMGETTLNFIATDPFAYSTIEKNQAFNDFVNGTTFTNAGTVESFPRIYVTPTATIQYVRISLGTKYIYVNGPFDLNENFYIDMNTNNVYLEATNERIMTQVTIDSDFWSFDTGDNLVMAEPTTGLALQFYWRERYL